MATWSGLATSGLVSTGVQLLSAKPGLLGVFPVVPVLLSRVSSLGFSDNEKRVVLDWCCPVPNKEACLPVSSCLLVSVWYVFGKNWLFRYSLLLFTRCAVGRSHTRCRLRPSRARGAEHLPKGWGHSGTDAQRLLSWGSRRVCFRRHGHEDDSFATWFRLSSPEGDAQHERVCWPYVLPGGCSYPNESFSVVLVHVSSSSPASTGSLVGSLCRGPHERLGLHGPLVLLRGWLHCSHGARSREVHRQVPWAIRRVLWLLVFLNLVGIDAFDYKRAPGRIAVEGRWPWRTTDVFGGSASRCTEAVQNDAARGRRRDTGAACARRHLFQWRFG